MALTDLADYWSNFEPHIEQSLLLLEALALMIMEINVRQLF